MWGSDYPHEEGTYPNSRATVDRFSEGMTEAEALAVFRETAADVFSFDPEVLATPGLRPRDGRARSDPPGWPWSVGWSDGGDTAGGAVGPAEPRARPTRRVRPDPTPTLT